MKLLISKNNTCKGSLTVLPLKGDFDLELLPVSGMLTPDIELHKRAVSADLCDIDGAKHYLLRIHSSRVNRGAVESELAIFRAGIEAEGRRASKRELKEKKALLESSLEKIRTEKPVHLVVDESGYVLLDSTSEKICDDVSAALLLYGFSPSEERLLEQAGTCVPLRFCLQYVERMIARGEAMPMFGSYSLALSKGKDKVSYSGSQIQPPESYESLPVSGIDVVLGVNANLAISFDLRSCTQVHTFRKLILNCKAETKDAVLDSFFEARRDWMQFCVGAHAAWTLAGCPTSEDDAEEDGEEVTSEED